MDSKAAQHTWDVLVVGSGIAGLRGALALAEKLDVLIVTKKRIRESNTNYAQGGIASVLAPGDSFEAHVRDTLEAGAGLCHEEVVRRVVETGPAMIADLVEQGIHFTAGDSGEYQLGREGGHSHRRIVHAGDFTGREIEARLVDRVRSHPRITLAEEHFAVDLLLDAEGRVGGTRVLDRERGRVHDVAARFTLLASGGCGKVYRYTSNPDIATGDGLAMAWRAGATLANLEFVQFHPTSLFHPEARNFLISEAVRGEGAVLRNLDGEAFMVRYDERADLAPRDVVARAIDREMKDRGDDHVLLDTTGFGAEFVERRFPNIAARCRDFGLDMVRQGLPVVPAAHYQCGGVVVDLRGRSDLEGLYVIGEAACTGLHGANRLASNSLLEALACAHDASQDILSRELPPEPRLVPAAMPSGTKLIPISLQHDWEVARKAMWDYVGIVRDEERLGIARERLGSMARDAEHFCQRHLPDADLYELRNVTLVGELIVRCAIFRRESRGLHAMREHEGPREKYLGDTCLQRQVADPWLRPLPAAGRATGASAGGGQRQ